MPSLDIPREITICIDQEEKVPLLFPKILRWRGDRTQKTHTIIVKEHWTRLPFGDYCLEIDGKRYDRTCSLERKFKPKELYKNLFTADWTRTAMAYMRLARSRALEPPFGNRYLLVEASPAELLTFEKREGLPHGIIFDRVCQVCAMFGFNLWLAPYCRAAVPRRRLGEQVLRVMMSHIFFQSNLHVMPPYTSAQYIAWSKDPRGQKSRKPRSPNKFLHQLKEESNAA